MKDTLYIAAKAPRIELTKTRLGRAIGHEKAVALYKAFLTDLAARFANAPFALGWYVTPPGAWEEIAPLIATPDGPEERVARVLTQPPGDWTERQRHLFREGAARGEDRMVLIASDSPQLTLETVEGAFHALDRHDLVLGPTYDGGYYLIGMRRYHDVLRGIPMSTNTVLEDITSRSEQIGLSVGWVETTFDIDEVDDLAYLRSIVGSRADLRTTRSSLEALGLYGNGRRVRNEQAATPIDASLASGPEATGQPKESE